LSIAEHENPTKLATKLTTKLAAKLAAKLATKLATKGGIAHFAILCVQGPYNPIHMLRAGGS